MVFSVYMVLTCFCRPSMVLLAYQGSHCQHPECAIVIMVTGKLISVCFVTAKELGKSTREW